MKTLDTLIEDIISLFKQVNTWNNGEFSKLVTIYCSDNNIDAKTLHSTLEEGFSMYLMTDMKSIDCIRSVINRDKKKLGY